MIKITEKTSPKERLEKYLSTHNVPIAKNRKELFAHSVKDDNGEEIKEFLAWHEDLRNEKSERNIK